MKKKTPSNLSDFKDFLFQIVRFYDKLQYVVIERFYLFFYFHILCVAKSG
jgi:hypothetical protein